MKTSILLLDKSLARQSETIAFFKVENDGFGLGAQRRAIEKNDLPQVQVELAAYLQALRAKAATDTLALTTGLIVPKEKIAANGDYNLSGERYQTGVVGQTRFPMVPLGDLADLIRGITFGKSEQLESANENSLLVATTKAAQESGIVEDDLYHIPRSLLKDETKLLRAGDILISTANSLNLLGRTTHIRKAEKPMSFGAFMSLIRPKDRILDGYLIHCLRTAYAADFFIRNANTTTNISNLNLSALAQFQIPLPPLEVQKEIVAEIEGYQKVINGARAVLDHYRPHIPIHPDWPMVRLGDLASEDCSLSYGIVQPGDELPDGLPIVRPVDLTSNLIRLSGLKRINPKAAEGYKRTTLQGGEVLLCVRGTTGVASVASPELAGANVTRGIVPIRFNPALALPAFGLIALCTESVQSQIRLKTYGATLQQINIGDLRELQIPLPPLATQQAIVAEIEAEQALVAANRELITRFERKIQATLARIWGEESPADSPA